MTLFRAPWAVDGAQIPSAVARAQTFSTSGGEGGEGITSALHFKVSALAVPGPGLRVAAGSCLVVNRYQATPNQTYTVFNDNEVTLDSSFMPPSSSSAASHLVCVTIGDPEFSQAGHPWMTSSQLSVEAALTYEYVRFYIIRNVPPGSTKFKNLTLHGYPAYALARLDIPPNTTTITDAMITDVRNVATPRSSAKVLTAPAADVLDDLTTVTAYEVFPSTASWSIAIPTWATSAKVMGYIEGVVLSKVGTGGLRVGFAAGGATQRTDLWETDFPGKARRGYNVGGEIAIPASYRGTTQTIRIEGSVIAAVSSGFLTADAKSGSLLLVIFEEAAA